MQRARVVAPNQIILEEAPIPAAQTGEVLIAIQVCGICGSDIHAFAGKHPFIDLPVVPGHEFSGVIRTLGAGVSGFKVSQRVTVEPSLVCGVCPRCRSGRYNICDNLRVIGCQADGAMAQYITVPADKVIALPDSISFTDAALIEPAAVGVHAVRRADVAAAQRIAIIGAGTIGLMTLQAALALGAREVIITDTIEERLSVARRLGVHHTVNVAATNLLEWMKQQYGESNPCDLVFECVGLEQPLDSAMSIAAKGARIVAVGVYPGRVTMPMHWVQDRELEIVGTLMYVRDDFLTAMEFIRQGKIQTAPLISRQEPLSNVVEVFATFEKGPGAAIKNLIEIVPQRK
jgi:L-iditol 2-dehydrogenase